MAEVKAYFHLKGIDEKAYNEYVELYGKMRKIEADFIRKFRETPEAKVIVATSNNQTPKYDILPQGIYPPTSVMVTYQVNVPLEPRKYMTVDASVLNALIHTKLLTDEEKRDLLREQGILKPKEVMPATPLEDTVT